MRGIAVGFGLLARSIEPPLLADLQCEAEERRQSAAFAEQISSLKYRVRIASLGPKAREFLRSEPMMSLLSAVFGGEYTLTEGRSCMTFYEEGDHLGPHLDQPPEECQVTIIIYVSAVSASPESPETGLVLRIYGQEPERDGAILASIPSRTGGIVLGRGSEVWHERPTLQKGECVASVTGCYALRSASDTRGQAQQ